MKKILFSIFLTISLQLPFPAYAKAALFDALDKNKLFDDLIAYVERLDAEILTIRRNRPESWKQTTTRLKQLFLNAKNDEDAYLVLQMLDATYPGLHTKISVPQNINPSLSLFQKFQLPFTFYPKRNDLSITFFVGQVLDGVKDLLKADDELLAIENISLHDLYHDALIFCDYAQPYQCAQELRNNFHFGFLRINLKDRKTVHITIKRNNVQNSLVVPIVSQEKTKMFYTSTKSSCFEESKRYSNAKPLYLGSELCLYEARQNIGILRVSSFATLKNKGGKEVSFQEDLEPFLAIWKNNYKKWKTLILDITGNGGGDVTVPLTALLVTQPFQDQWVRFKNIPEFKDPLFFKQLYNADVFVATLSKNKNLKGDFYPPIPQFPVSGGEITALYDPHPNVFSGRIVTMVDRNCISSCSGFLWTLHRYDQERLITVGQPDSGDSTYERMNIVVFQDPLRPEGYRIHVLPTKFEIRAGRQSLFHWKVSVALTTDKNGTVYSMKPDPVDYWIDDKTSHREWLLQTYKQAYAIANQ